MTLHIQIKKLYISPCPTHLYHIPHVASVWARRHFQGCVYSLLQCIITLFWSESHQPHPMVVQRTGLMAKWKLRFQFVKAVVCSCVCLCLHCDSVQQPSPRWTHREHISSLPIFGLSVSYISSNICLTAALLRHQRLIQTLHWTFNQKHITSLSLRRSFVFSCRWIHVTHLVHQHV